MFSTFKVEFNPKLPLIADILKKPDCHDIMKKLEGQTAGTAALVAVCLSGFQ
jgi:hypothetical protein